jgi:UDP-glucose 4-epimerase
VILVTGGTGFVGRHLVDALAARGDAVRVLTRHRPTSASHPSVEHFAGDLTDRAAIDRAVHGAHTVVHLAALVGDAAHPDDLATVNVRASADVAAAARRAGVRRFVHMSSGGVYGNGETATPHRETDPPRPRTAYERSKLAGEEAVQRALGGSEVAFLILRPAGIYGASRGETLAFFNEVRRRTLWLHASPNVIVHPTHVSDVVQACIRTLRLDAWTDRVINIAGERPVRFQEFVDLTARALHVRAAQLAVPAWIGRPVASTAMRLLQIVRAPVPVSIERASRAHINRSLDTSLAKRALGLQPIELEVGLRQTAEAAAGPL